MPYTKAISPVSNSYLTKGKEYEILFSCKVCSYPGAEIGEYEFVFRVKSDDGKSIYCNQHNCYYTNGLSWQLK